MMTSAQNREEKVGIVFIAALASLYGVDSIDIVVQCVPHDSRSRCRTLLSGYTHTHTQRVAPRRLVKISALPAIVYGHPMISTSSSALCLYTHTHATHTAAVLYTRFMPEAIKYNLWQINYRHFSSQIPLLNSVLLLSLQNVQIYLFIFLIVQLFINLFSYNVYLMI